MHRMKQKLKFIRIHFFFGGIDIHSLFQTNKDTYFHFEITGMSGGRWKRIVKRESSAALLRIYAKHKTISL